MRELRQVHILMLAAGQVRCICKHAVNPDISPVMQAANRCSQASLQLAEAHALEH